MASEESNSQAGNITTSDQVNLWIAEYNALREEIVKHIEIEHQLISLALIAPGTILTIGFQTNNASLIFLYPILGLFLSIVWLANYESVYNLASYIRTHIEANAGHNNIGWESTRKSTLPGWNAWSDSLYFYGSRGILIGTELLALLAGLLLTKHNLTENILLAVASVSSIVTIILLLIRPART